MVGIILGFFTVQISSGMPLIQLIFIDLLMNPIRTCAGEKRKKLRYRSLETSSPVLIMCLKRFDINFANMSRFKINTKFEFPLVLDVASLKQSGNGFSLNVEEDQTLQSDKPTDKANITSSIRRNMIWLEQLKTKKGEKDAQRRYQRLRSLDPKNIYELYAIVIHSGCVLL